MDDDAMHLGPCCVCDAPTGARNVLMLHLKAPISGRGWGCVVCGLPSDGAVAVVCDGCLGQPLKFACRGYPARDGRVPIAEVTGVHEHDLLRHPLSDLEDAAMHEAGKRVASESNLSEPSQRDQGSSS